MIIIAILAVTFIAGAMAGAVALLCMGIAREESDKSLHDEPPTRAAAATRRLVGWHGSLPQQVNRPGRRPEWVNAGSGR